MRLARSLLEALKDLLFPPCCLDCGRRLEHSRPPLFCSDCLGGPVAITSPLCRCCGLPFSCGVDHLCEECLRSPLSFDLARSAFLYTRPVAGLILSLKFGGDLSGLDTITALVGDTPALHELTCPDLIVPVPLHPRRLRRRGFNQSVVLARACLPQWRTRIRPELLRRIRDTTAQSQLTGEQRRRNLRNAFLLCNSGAETVRGKRLLLVDDVFTTGSTVRECAMVLRQAGAARIEVFTLARSLGPGAQTTGHGVRPGSADAPLPSGIGPDNQAATRQQG
ncbi:MAG: ComF family protein [Desulfobulbus sp.]|jgi:ComF family protein